MRLTKPPALSIGDTVGIVSPCLPLLPQFKDFYSAGTSELKKLGFVIKQGATLNKNHWWSGGTPAEQAADIHRMFADPAIKAVIASSGGNSAISVLELLDYGLIASNPKPFIGMSDMTAYHLALYAKTGLIGFHMDEVCFGIGMNWQQAEPAAKKQASDMFMRVLTKAEPLGDIPALRARKTWRPGQAEGRLIGGNLSSLARQVGTPYFPSPEQLNGAILFWEAVGLYRYEISRMLYQLKYAGVFDRIAGMLVGTITATKKAGDEGLVEPTLKDLTLEALKEYDFPILAGLDFGHYTVNMPMPLGVKARMDAAKQTLALTDSAVV